MFYICNREPIKTGKRQSADHTWGAQKVFIGSSFLIAISANPLWHYHYQEEGKDVTNYKFVYKMNGDYITEMSMIEESEEVANIRIEIFYED